MTDIKEMIVVHREEGKLQDSIEIGTPAKGGAIKVYCDFSNVEATQEKIKKAFEARKYAQMQEQA